MGTAFQAPLSTCWMGEAGPPRLILPGPRKTRALIRLEDSAEEITESVLAVVAHPGQAGHPSPPVAQ